MARRAIEQSEQKLPEISVSAQARLSESVALAVCSHHERCQRPPQTESAVFCGSVNTPDRLAFALSLMVVLMVYFFNVGHVDQIAPDELTLSGNTLAQLDTSILSDELPLSAYSDQGFVTFYTDFWQNQPGTAFEGNSSAR
ncbi:MAG: DUF3619 family protein [Limnobacter sp.]|nr:DUF3619 family protein [Limnobacter sp.]